MTAAQQKMHDFYNRKPGAKIRQEEFGFYCLDRWKEEGHIPTDASYSSLAEMFGYDLGGKHSLGQLGWCEAGLVPVFEEKVLEDRGEYELVQDFAGRSVLCFKGRRSGFMPEYVDHPVKDMKTFEELIVPRMNPTDSRRYEDLGERMERATRAAESGDFICQNLVGGYMYLRSLMGPLELLYAVHDQPELIHRCMEVWFQLADKVIGEHQKHVTLDELFLAEDICYNTGCLISPDMMREFLFPYYQQLIKNIKTRQLDCSRHLFIQIDTDGFCVPVIDLYREIGMDFMSPFEVASNCDVVAIRKAYPELLMRGGIDKRILAESKEAIDREIDRIMPFMVAQGGFIPTCDHGVPEEVSFENYVHYRKRMLEF